MKNSEIKTKLHIIHQNAAAFRLSRNVMDAKEYKRRIHEIIDGLEELIKEFDGRNN